MLGAGLGSGEGSFEPPRKRCGPASGQRGRGSREDGPTAVRREREASASGAVAGVEATASVLRRPLLVRRPIRRYSLSRGGGYAGQSVRDGEGARWPRT
mgnify:CR=1 FL=1